MAQFKEIVLVMVILIWKQIMFETEGLFCVRCRRDRGLSNCKWLLVISAMVTAFDEVGRKRRLTTKVIKILR